MLSLWRARASGEDNMQTATAIELQPGLWASDPEHSSLRFSVPFLGIGRITGVFRHHRASAVVGENGMIERFDFEIEADSVDTNDEVRDLLITSMDFLDVENHPTIKYQSAEIVPTGEAFTVYGRLVINGMAHLVTVIASISRPVTTSRGAQFVGVEATGHVSRVAFGLREALDPETRAQPDADLIQFTSDLTLRHRPD